MTLSETIQLVANDRDIEVVETKLKTASGILLDIIGTDTAEIVRDISELIGTDGLKLKYFSDLVHQRMQENDQRQAMASFTLHHYMKNNASYIDFLKQNSCRLVSIQKALRFRWTLKGLALVAGMVCNYCIHLESHEKELAELLNHVISYRDLMRSRAEVAKNPSYFSTQEARTTVEAVVRNIPMSYLNSADGAKLVAEFFFSCMKESVRLDDKKTLSDIVSRMGDLMFVSDCFSKAILEPRIVNSPAVLIYKKHLAELDTDKEYHKLFRTREDCASSFDHTNGPVCPSRTAPPPPPTLSSGPAHPVAAPRATKNVVVPVTRLQ